MRPYEEMFGRGGEGGLVATERTVLHRPGWTKALRSIRTFLIGRPISSEREEHERLTKLKALAIFSSDNISSSAYATEGMMRILVLAGVSALSLTLPLTLAIIVVLAIVAMSYRQTIRAYPHGASAYLVASDTLGTAPGLVAAAALLIDYVLTVAVSISAGVAAITSIFPETYPERVLIAVGAVAVLSIGNLRGIRESGTIFMAPTYLYIAAVAGVIGIGLVRFVSGDLAPYAVPESWAGEWLAEGAQPLALLLVLRAFSSGAVALTGTEAISDGVPAFKPPEWRNARTTLTWAAAIFGSLFLGISFLSSTVGIVPDPSEQQTVLSQLTRHLAGSGSYLYFVQFATAVLLLLAANTSFADFPRLSSFLARDGFMPRQFAFRGERLAFTTGILALAGFAIVLLIAFSASVTALIPLYTLGVFLAFTLSQSGMVVRWWTRRETGWRQGIVVNGAGAITTAVVALIVVASKFTAGAWMVVIMVPIIVAGLLAIRGHYRTVDAHLRVPVAPTSPARMDNPFVIVPVARLDEAARQAIAFANTISPRAVAVHVTNDPQKVEELRREWPVWSGGAELVVIESPYRALIGPLLAYLDVLQRHEPERPVVVVLPEFVPRHWWENLLHNQTALRIKLRLFSRPNTIVADVPYHLGRRPPPSSIA